MKTLNLSIVVIISVIAFGVSTVHSSYSTEFNATMDKMYYNGTDTAYVVITGPPSTPVNLAIIDSSSQQKLVTVVHVDPNGTGIFSFNLASFSDGVYYAIVGQGYGSVKIGFGVGLMPSGPIIALNVIKDTYVSGDSITIRGAEGPNGVIQLSLIDPNGNVVKSVQTNSDNTGLFSSYDLKIPTNAISGIWKVMATHGVTHSSLDIKVNSMSNGVGKNNTNATNGGGGSIVTIHMDSPLKQFKSGIPISKIQCAQDLSLVIKAEDGTPACVKQESISKLILRGWISTTSLDQNNSISGDFYQGIEDDSGIVSVKNQTYYMMTATNTTYPIPSGMTIRFHQVTFSFPYGSQATPGGVIIPFDMTFPDGTTETYGKVTKNPDGSGSISGIGLGPGPSSNRTVTVQSVHTHPQAGVTMTEDQIKLLVSTENQNDTGTTTIGNHVYYFTTLNDTLSSYHGVGAIPFTFNGIDFTLFPSVFSAGPPGSCGDTNFGSEVKFADGTYEKLGVHVPGPPCVENYTETVFSNHQNPQAGLQVYQGKIRLLASVQQTTSSNSSSGPEYKVGPDLLGPVPHQLVFFMKSNSTAKIFVEYTSDLPNTGTLPSYSSVYLGNNGNFTPLATSDVTITADPPSIPMNQGSDTIVVYTITTKEGVKGVYWIFLVQFCRVMPVAVDINSLTISPTEIPVQTGTMHCPAQELDGKILGISGGTAEYKIGTPVH